MREDKVFRHVWFPEWASALGQEPWSPAEREACRLAIVRYLCFCRETRQPVTVASAREFAGRIPAGDLEFTKRCLNWFFAGAASRGRGAAPPDAPDLGSTPWERRLIACIRNRHLRWRTEQTYRGWAWRFAEFLDTRHVEGASEDDVRRFLTHLATARRVSAATQKQALNALVFLLREAFCLQLGDFGDFLRARRPYRLPVVLTKAECRRLFEALEGTARLMAEFMYGSGLRLTELLERRVQDVDLDRRLIRVRAGKGDKDRTTVLPDCLVDRLREHLRRLRALHELDRAKGYPGVWLPEALARKYPKAGEA